MKPALHFPRFGKTMLAAALVAMAGTGCATDQSLLGKLGGVFGAPAQAKSAAAGKAIEGDITSTKALEFLYGEVRHNGRNKSGVSESTWDCAEWVPLPLPEAFFVSTADGSSPNAEHRGKKAEACKVLGEKYSEDGVEKYMLVMLSKFFAGSGEEMEQNVIIHTVTLAKRDGQWHMESHKDFVEEAFVALDPVLEVYATRGGADKKPGVLFLAGAGGFCMRSAPQYYLSAFMPYGNEVKKFAVGRSLKKKSVTFVGGRPKEYDTGETETILATCCDDGMYCPKSVEFMGHFDAHAKWDAQSQGEYHDIVVTYEGDGKAETQRWAFQNGKFVEAKAAKKGGKKASAKKRK
ncbi:MAG: hypothetical protein IKX21_01515 [Deltaproteobacteria bacterium]|nr:hypothetical protein [Deltaproteobacteria bacterium]